MRVIVIVVIYYAHVIIGASAQQCLVLLEMINNYCESGLSAGQNWQQILYSSDPLWDGQQCYRTKG